MRIRSNRPVAAASTLQPGQTLDYDGAAPLQVVLGRASGVEVFVRGQVFDTSAYAPNKVARFEVK